MVYTRKTEDVFDLMYDYGYGDGLERICSCSTYKEANEFVLAPHIRKLWRIAKLILRMKEFAQRL